jgi:hypothetical protein|tara:strand:+ start:405 stop:776 length:372 start_codon:yes stop_codon:yes gene_type:complete
MLTTTGIIIMTAYTVGMLYSVVYDTTRKTSQRIGKILLSIGEGILLYTGSVWFLVLSLSMIAISALSIMTSVAAKEYIRWELARIAVSRARQLSVRTVVGGTAVATSLGVVALYGVMVTWGIA